MAKYIIDGETLTGMADALRKVTGETRTYTPGEMIEAVTTILDDVVYILEDDNGNEVVAVMSENEVVFDATANDIRAGKIAATATGITEGTKEIPAYRADEGSVKIKVGQSMDIPLLSDMCHYTVFQAIVCDFNADMYNSVSAEKVVINDSVYNTGSTSALADVRVDADLQTIKLGVTNTSSTPDVIHYMIIKEDD